MSFKMHYTSNYLFLTIYYFIINFFIIVFFFHVGPAWYLHYFTHFPLNLHYKGRKKKKKRKNVE
jgi:hypothetical protein